MSEKQSHRCKKCGILLGYVNVVPQSYLETKPVLINVKLVGTCTDCSGELVFTEETFNMRCQYKV